MSKVFFENLQEGSFLFNRFFSLRCLYAHTNGAIYLCLDEKRELERVALKVVTTASLKEEISGLRFQNEMEISSMIKHPNVVRCYDFFQDSAFTAFSMEYMDGGTLADLISKEAPLSLSRAYGILKQISSGLSAIHKSGIIHRDLKPENVLLDRRGGVKIGDFGIAVVGKSIVAGEDEVIIGTINYLSPEYIERGYFDARSDIYSLGLIAYEMLTGTLPIYGKSPLERLALRVQADPVPPIVINRNIPPQINSAVLKALKRDPEDRFQTAEEFIKAFKLSEEELNKAPHFKEIYRRSSGERNLQCTEKIKISADNDLLKALGCVRESLARGAVN